MSSSRRIRRMQRNHKRNQSGAKLNLVSLMDIFTILVLFLIVNVSTEKEIQVPGGVVLPKSTAEQKPKPTITVIVSNDSISVQGKRVVEVRSISKNRETIPQLERELTNYTKKLTKEEKKRIKQHGITVVGDKGIPFRLLKQVMKTCAESDFTNIALAVEQREGDN